MNKYVKAFLFVVIVSGISEIIARFLKNDPTVPAAEVPTIAAPVTDTAAANSYNKHMVDSAISLLKSGYIVVRTGLGADSYLLAQMNRKDKTYSHCGIVMVEHGYPFVYHSIGGEDNPDARMRRDSAFFFFSPQHNIGFGIIAYNYSDTDVSRLQQVVNTYYKQRPKFDMKFDLKTDDKLYCAEFIYKAVNKTMADSLYIKPTFVMGYTFVGIDDLYFNDHARIIWQVKFK